MPRPVEIIQAEETIASKSPLRRSCRIIAVSSPGPSEVKPLKGRRLSTSSENKDDEVDSSLKGKRASLVDKENLEQKAEPAKTRTRRSSATSVTSESSVKENETNKPIRSRRSSVNKEEEVPKSIKSRRSSNQGETEEEPLKIITRGRRSSLQEDKEENTPNKKGKGINSTQVEKEEELKQRNTRSRRSASRDLFDDVDKTESSKEKDTKRITRSRRSSTDVSDDEPNTKLVKTPIKAKRRPSASDISINLERIDEKEQESESPVKSDHENPENLQKKQDSNKYLELSVICENSFVEESEEEEIQKRDNTPIKKKVENEHKFAAENSVENSTTKTNTRELTATRNSPSENISVRKSPRIQEKLEKCKSGDHSPHKKCSCENEATSVSPSEAKEKTEHESPEVTNLTPKKSSKPTGDLNNSKLQDNSFKNNQELVMDKNIAENENNNVFLSENTVQIKGDKLKTHLSDGSDGSFTFNLSHNKIAAIDSDTDMNDSKTSDSSDKENCVTNVERNAKNPTSKKNILDLLTTSPNQALVHNETRNRVSNVFCPKDVEFSFVEPMEIDMTVNLDNSRMEKSQVNLGRKSEVNLSNSYIEIPEEQITELTRNRSSLDLKNDEQGSVSNIIQPEFVASEVTDLEKIDQILYLEESSQKDISESNKINPPTSKEANLQKRTSLEKSNKRLSNEKLSQEDTLGKAKYTEDCTDAAQEIGDLIASAEISVPAKETNLQNRTSLEKSNQRLYLGESSQKDISESNKINPSTSKETNLQKRTSLEKSNKRLSNEKSSRQEDTLGKAKYTEDCTDAAQEIEDLVASAEIKSVPAKEINLQNRTSLEKSNQRLYLGEPSQKDISESNKINPSTSKETNLKQIISLEKSNKRLSNEKSSQKDTLGKAKYTEDCTDAAQEIGDLIENEENVQLNLTKQSLVEVDKISKEPLSHLKESEQEQPDVDKILKEPLSQLSEPEQQLLELDNISNKPLSQLKESEQDNVKKDHAEIKGPLNKLTEEQSVGRARAMAIYTRMSEVNVFSETKSDEVDVFSESKSHENDVFSETKSDEDDVFSETKSDEDDRFSETKDMSEDYEFDIPSDAEKESVDLQKSDQDLNTIDNADLDLTLELNQSNETEQNTDVDTKQKSEEAINGGEDYEKPLESNNKASVFKSNKTDILIQEMPDKSCEVNKNAEEREIITVTSHKINKEITEDNNSDKKESSFQDMVSDCTECDESINDENTLDKMKSSFQDIVSDDTNEESTQCNTSVKHKFNEMENSFENILCDDYKQVKSKEHPEVDKETEVDIKSTSMVVNNELNEISPTNVSIGKKSKREKRTHEQNETSKEFNSSKEHSEVDKETEADIKSTSMVINSELNEISPTNVSIGKKSKREKRTHEQNETSKEFNSSIIKDSTETGESIKKYKKTKHLSLKEENIAKTNINIDAGLKEKEMLHDSENLNNSLKKKTLEEILGREESDDTPSNKIKNKALKKNEYKKLEDILKSKSPPAKSKEVRQHLNEEKSCLLEKWFKNNENVTEDKKDEDDHCKKKRMNTNIVASVSLDKKANKKAESSKPTLEEFASNKLDKYLESKMAEFDEVNDTNSYSTDEEENSFLDDMAEEGEEDTPSEDSNAIIDEGEEINTCSERSEEDYSDVSEDDSFICKEEYFELLSGDEYDLGDEKKKKTSRILNVEDRDEEIIKIEKKPKVRRKIKSRIIKMEDSSDSEVEMAGPVSDESDVSIQTKNGAFSQKPDYTVPTQNKSSITIIENINVKEIKDTALSERINHLVDTFCTTIPQKGDVSMNLSLEYANKVSSKDKKKSKKRRSTDYKRESSSEGVPAKEKRLSVSLTEEESNKVVSSPKRRLSQSMSEISNENKNLKKKKVKRSNRKNTSSTETVDSDDLRKETFSLMNQLVTDVKNRPRRNLIPTTTKVDALNTSWFVEVDVEAKPSTSAVSKEEMEEFQRKKLHPKDFRNQMLYNSSRVRREPTKNLLRKKSVFY